MADALNTLNRAARNWGIGGVALMLAGGSLIYPKVQDRLDRVEQDHVRMLSHIGRVEQGQAYVLCIIEERNKPDGSPRNCDDMKPRRTQDDQLHGDADGSP